MTAAATARGSCGARTVLSAHSHQDQMGIYHLLREGMLSAGGVVEVEAGCSPGEPYSVRAEAQRQEPVCRSLSSRRTGPGFERKIAGSGVGTRGSGKDMPWGCSPPIGELRHLVGNAGLGKFPDHPLCIARRELESARGARLAWWAGSGVMALEMDRWFHMPASERAGVVT